MSTFQGPRDWIDNYGTRIHGYVHPPVTGQYTFYLSSDDGAELWLSPDDNPNNPAIAKIVEHTGASGYDDWSAASSPVTLNAGQKYYIRALHKEGTGNDHIRVGWQLPGGTLERPIPGHRLSPFMAWEYLAHWKLDEPPGSSTAADSSGNGFTGTVNGSPVFEPSGGRDGGCLTFSAAAANQYVATGRSLLGSVCAFTIAVWVKPASFGSRRGICGQNDCVEFGLDNNSVYVWCASGGSVTAQYPYSAGEWHHVAVVGSGADLRVYLDGVLAATGGSATTYYGVQSANPNPFNIGGGGIYDATGNWFDGSLDDIRVYDRALAPGEVADLFAGVSRRYWVGGSGNWSDDMHWSRYSGGPGGAPAPDSGTTAVFDGFSGGTCTVDQAVNVGGVELAGVQAGLLAECYDGTSFDTYLGTYVDQTVDFNPADDALGTARCGGNDTFSVRWTGQVKANADGTIQFWTYSDDGVRLWVNGALIIDNWSTHQFIWNSGNATYLVNGQWYDIKLEFFESGGESAIRLAWGAERTIIPSTNLRTGASVTIDQGSSTITVGARGWSQSSAAFTGGSATIDVNGPFSLAGGSFTSTSGVLQVAGDFSVSGGTFVHNGGTVRFDGSQDQLVSPGASTFNHMEVNAPGRTVRFAGDMTLAGDLLVTAGTASTGWWNTGWARCRRLALDNSAQASALTDFPILVRLDSSNFDFGAARDNGEDIRFVDADGSTVLSHEIERWSKVSQLAEIWVKVPHIPAGSSADCIWMYWGNPSAPDAQDPAGVWSNGYVGVWHLSQDPAGGAGAIRDSTANPIHGTCYNMTSADLVDAQIGKGLNFSGDGNPNADHVRIPSTGSDKLSITGSYITLEAWVRRGAATGGWMNIVSRQFGSGGGDAYGLAIDGSGSNLYLFAGTGGQANANGVTPQDTWVYAVGVKDGSSIRIYTGGVQRAEATGQTGSISTDANDVTIGAQDNDGDLNPEEQYSGLIDEVRISNVPRSAAWIAAQHRSMTGAFVAMGPEGTNSISVGGELAIAAGASLLAPGATVTCSGDFTNNGTYFNVGGTTVFDADATIGGATATTFDDLTVTGGAAVLLAADATVAGALSVEAGSTLTVQSGRTLTLSSSSTLAGALVLQAGSTLALADGVALTMATGSTFTASGTGWGAGEYVLVTSAGSGHYSITLGGNVTVAYAEFRHLAASGLALSGGAGAGASMHHVSFRSNEGGSGSRHMLISGSAWNGYTFDWFSFEGLGSLDPEYAVAITSGGAVTMTNYDTAANRIWGDAYDNEVSGTVAWSGATPAIETDVSAVDVPEGSTGGFQVRLSAQPASDVTVSVARVSGDSDISVQSGASLVFTTANWNAYQSVVLAAAEDADTTNGSATIRCSAAGLADKDVTATEIDNDATLPPAAFSLVAPADNATDVALAPEFTWGASFGATSYTLEVDDDPLFGSPLYAVPSLVGTSYASTTVLAAGATYHWRVTAVNAGGTRPCDASFSFTTTTGGSASDWDGDGLTNAEEASLTTDPRKKDTDDDGMPDGWEVSKGTDPLVSDGGADPDGDMTSNLEEYRDGTDPLVNDLPGIGGGTGGCAPSGGAAAGALAWLALVAAPILTSRRRSLARRSAIIAAAGAIWGCAGQPALRAASVELPEAVFAPEGGIARFVQAAEEQRPVSTTQLEDFPAGWGLKAGGATYLNTNTREVAPRAFLGAYYHFGETDVSRMEIGLAFAPDVSALYNRYLSLSAHYLRFVGASGRIWFEAGAGGIFETRGEAEATFGLLEAGAGLWFELGENKGLLAGAALQFPLGGDVNAPLVVALSAGLDF